MSKPYDGRVRADARFLPIADETVQCVVTSPPYYGLRDYGLEGQIGGEATPREFIHELLIVFAEVNRVLKSDGVLWVNMGDSYARSGGLADGGNRARWVAVDLGYQDLQKQRMANRPLCELPLCR